MANDLVKFESATGQEVTFTSDDVRQRLCPQIDDRELAMVMALCQAQHLNPFTGDVYIQKFEDKRNGGYYPASFITSKEVFTKRAQANPKFDGLQAGLTFLVDGKIVQREGSMTVSGWTLIGGWCKVYVKGYRVPMYDEVALSEYNTGRNNWEKMPGTMIRKVALCHALREAFPDEFQGLYGAEEMGKAGESIKETDNGASEAASAPQSDTQDVVAEADFVEMMSDQQQATLSELAGEFAALCGKGFDEVVGALMDSRSVKASGAVGFDGMTADQAEVAIGVLSSWVEKSAAAKETAEELRESDLADKDIVF